MKAPILYLASKSPRRKDLLKQAGLAFRVFVPKEAELSAPKKVAKTSPRSIVRNISRAKARAALAELRARGTVNGLILSADTLVFQSGRVLGKPRNRVEAKRMLQKLSGRWHLVCTGVTCLSFNGQKVREKTICVSTRVKFVRLKNHWIEWYIATDEPMDKAGAYGAQGQGAAFVEKFSGSYTNVVGLPLAETLSLLESVGGVDRSRLQRKS